MRLVFELLKENLNLSEIEVKRLLNPKDLFLKDNFLFAALSDNDQKEEYYKRLALTKNVYGLLFTSTKESLLKDLLSFPLHEFYSKSYKVIIRGFDSNSKEKIIDTVYSSLSSKTNAIVDVKIPYTEFVFLAIKDEVFVLLKKWKNKEDFNSRKAHNRPAKHPTSLDPRLARACINISGIKSGTVLDPFCGTGGILIEAGILGFNVFGMDLSESMLKAAEKNLKHYKIKNFKLTSGNACMAKTGADAIITDIPYGRNTRIDGELNSLVKDFLSNAYFLTDIAVVMVPHFADLKSALGKWKIKSQFEIYLHKSLTKMIYLLEK